MQQASWGPAWNILAPGSVGSGSKPVRTGLLCSPLSSLSVFSFFFFSCGGVAADDTQSAVAPLPPKLAPLRRKRKSPPPAFRLSARLTLLLLLHRLVLFYPLLGGPRGWSMRVAVRILIVVVLRTSTRTNGFRYIPTPLQSQRHM